MSALFRACLARRARGARLSSSAVQILRSAAAPAFARVANRFEPLSEVLEEVPPMPGYFGEEGGRPAERGVTPVQLSELECGLRVVSEDRGGGVASLGLFLPSGTAHGGPARAAAAMAWQSTAFLSNLRLQRTLEAAGAVVSCTAAREHTVYEGEALREHVPLLVPALLGNVLYPRLLRWEMDAVASSGEPPDAQAELLHQTAWQGNTYGLPTGGAEPPCQGVTPEALREYVATRLDARRGLLVGVNVRHSELVSWAMRTVIDGEYSEAAKARVRAGELEPTKATARPVPLPALEPRYTGGLRAETAPEPLLHLTVAFGIAGGWDGPQAVAAAVAQAALGGGGSFSTGGPGKGMHSRLYQEVLLRERGVDAAQAVQTQYAHGGLLALSAAGADARTLARVLRAQWARAGTLTPDDLSRAQNAIKTSIHLNLEHPKVARDDLANQLLHTKALVDADTFERAVDAVTLQDVQDAFREITRTPPTILAYGNLTTLGDHKELYQEFTNIGM